MTTGNFAARLVRANLAAKVDITDFVKEIFWTTKKNSTKKLLQIKRNVLKLNKNNWSKKSWKYIRKRVWLLGRMYFPGDDGCWDLFNLCPMLSSLLLDN